MRRSSGHSFWLRRHSEEYSGQWVALHGYTLLSYGSDARGWLERKHGELLNLDIGSGGPKAFRTAGRRAEAFGHPLTIPRVADDSVRERHAHDASGRLIYSTNL